MELSLLQSSLNILKRNQKLILRSSNIQTIRKNYNQPRIRYQSTSNTTTYIPALSHSSSTSTQLTSPSEYGQPLPSTHPHLLKPGELTIGISADEYESRRKKLMDGLEEGAIVIVAGGKLKYLSGQILQASNFWYLTGWEEPDSVLILEKNSTMRGFKMTLFCPSKDPNMELWHGARSGVEGAVEVFGADDACDITLLTTRLRSILTASSSSYSTLAIYCDIPGVRNSSSSNTSRFRRTKANSSLLDLLVPTSIGGGGYEEVASILSGEKGRSIRSAASQIESMRLIKSEAEIRVMRKAADISSDAHAKVMRFAEPTFSSNSNITESSLVAHFEYLTALAGSPRLAYVPVCASGVNGIILHYISNQLPLFKNDLILLDAGCEYGGYASDITRTFPISGEFTGAQKDLYEAVLRVEKECIKFCSEKDGMSLDDLHKKSVELTRVELRDLGFTNLKGGEIERSLYPHYVGHCVGIDLHDSPNFGRHEKLKDGMVITIEPGLRIPPHSNFPKHFHNLSVRIEDEIHVRKEDYIILSVDAPKELIDVEACCQGLLEGKEY